MTLLSTVLCLALIAYPVLCIIFTKKLSVTAIVAIGLGIESFYSIPWFVMNYFKLYERPLGSKTFIAFLPHVNSVSCMSSILQWMCNISGVIVILSLVLLYVPGWIALAPDAVILQAQDVLPSIVLVSLICYNTLIGVGLYLATVDLRKIYSKNLPSRQTTAVYKVIDSIFRFLPLAELPILILPVVRSASLIPSIEKMSDLVRLNMTAFTEEEEDDF